MTKFPEEDISKKATLERLRDEMEQTKALYEGAREAYEKAMRHYDERLPEAPSEGFRRASDAQDSMLMNYANALRRFNAFLLEGKLLGTKKPEKQSDS